MKKANMSMCNRCGFFFIPDYAGEKFCNHCANYNKRYDMKAHYLRKGDAING